MAEPKTLSPKIEPIEKHLKARRQSSARTQLDSVDEAIEDYRSGRFVFIVDVEDRENEGDLCLAG